MNTGLKNLLLSPLLGVTKIVEDTLDKTRQLTEMVRTGNNPYLVDNFAPVEKSNTNLPMQVIHGALPHDLRGAFLRNGPNPVFSPKGLYHWFDGDGMIHAVRLRGHEGGNPSTTQATYTNHQIRTHKLAYEQSQGSADWLGVGDLKGPLGLLKMALFNARTFLGDTTLVETLSKPLEGVANTSIKFHAGRLLASVEMSQPCQIHMDPSGSMETIGTYSFDNKLTHGWTAHPKVDPVTGEMITFCYNIASAPYANYTVVDNTGRLVSTIDLNLPKPIMMHDCTITARYTIFMDLPLQFDPSNMGKKMDGGAFVFNKEAPARFGVLPRHAKDANEMQWFDVQACAIFHVVNSYEDINAQGEDIIVLQACRFTTIDLSNMNSTDADLKEYNEVWVWELNMTTGNVDREEPMLPTLENNTVSGDFPQINPMHVGRKQKYCWLSRFSQEHNTKFDGIVKIDCDNGKVVGVFEYGQHKRGGEIVFVPREGATSEDDGYLVGFVHDEKQDVSTFYVIDAKTMGSSPICICQMPKRVPYGMHASFVSEAELMQGEKMMWETKTRSKL